MSCDRFDPDCPDCGPVIVDISTGKALPDDHPTMQRIMRAWRGASLAEQEAFWRVTVKNSRDPGDLGRCQRILAAMKAPSCVLCDHPLACELCERCAEHCAEARCPGFGADLRSASRKETN